MNDLSQLKQHLDLTLDELETLVNTRLPSEETINEIDRLKKAYSQLESDYQNLRTVHESIVDRLSHLIKRIQAISGEEVSCPSSLSP